mmetsp:Transcript_25704/g.37916  ORF Transcript_25704/g.37916 Transcript_25704/m.37916 type:complete len:397 (+) Transcript_25704:100-1290(+)|eukprot:CAMPEP_0195516696 /NCGR_PEP_ID=MMETSP0794_2-20130614/8283_1 /TAXON_ID=515487 /ORGANISM="Stephanopyxis turris, Strain CCMP 815" /LENGTH=396 /DNA_ID=CAMNT_0040645351 /DNA_START=79 /DNA_END=1269 /DNA_ORIENTATION=+
MKLPCVVAAVLVGSASADVASYQNWSPQPASDLGSTAVEFGVHSVCEGQYMGNDCSEKVCAFGLSSNVSPFLSQEGLGDNLWAPNSNQYVDDYFNGNDRALKDGGVHTYTECSSQGICDRATGTCNCFDGYSGKGCRRTVCPNDCSGHGICSRNIDANSAYVTSAPKLSYASQYWDGEKTMRCQCDRGYEGADCSDRICPHGDDVLTTCAADSNHDVQVITFTDPTSAWDTQQDAGGAPLFYTLTFEDHFGGVYKTRPIALNKVENQNALDAQAALEALPNSAIPSVQVSSSVTDLTVTVSFTDAATTGKQNTLVAAIINSDLTCEEGGQQPYTQNDAALDDLSVAVAHQGLADEDSNYEENVPCGNRGICDSSVGKCECFEGHTGEACEIQSVFV